MRVILKEDVAHLGNMGDIVKVADGYGRNYLLPQGLAELATEERANAFAHQKAMIEHKKAKLHKEAEALQEKINGIAITLARAAVKDDTQREAYKPRYGKRGRNRKENEDSRKRIEARSKLQLYCGK